jgi:DNA-binding Lrp family transcriptional regulator
MNAHKQKLDDSQISIICKLLRNSEISESAIAKRMNCSRVSVYRINIRFKIRTVHVRRRPLLAQAS